ncbi:hypothetical protein F503_04273 [Ophiostoma piceae UAMH 11346]|uniref:Uncharacterized protein n=1 Tax=Ophiostoma piceae (strain UAMH 11346) TaxID=1262450 RepID=S3C9S6_OPHP1|nr:hypothetical protein F503_04273 [Ophiostoma piceae UAMH 11346]
MAPTFRPARARRPRSDSALARRDGQLLDTVRDNAALSSPATISPTPILANDVPSTTLLDRSVKTSLVPAGYGNTQSGPSSGTVVGITLGAVAGFLLFIALIYACVNYGTFGLFGGFGRGKSSRSGSTFFASTNASSVLEASSYVSRRVHEHKRDRRRSSGSKRHRRHSHKARPIIVDPPMERVVIKEHIRRTSRPAPRPRPGPSIVETASDGSGDDEIIVEEEIEEDRRRRQRSRVESDDDSEDEVVVIEEDSSRVSRPPRSSRGGSSRMSSRRR